MFIAHHATKMVRTGGHLYFPILLLYFSQVMCNLFEVKYIVNFFALRTYYI